MCGINIFFVSLQTKRNRNIFKTHKKKFFDMLTLKLISEETERVIKGLNKKHFPNAE